MINNKRVVALIPARGGSKSIPKKNITLLAGKPLIGWSIETALKTKEIDRVIVSTDCKEIAKVAKLFGAEVRIRPDKLSTDDSLVIDTIRHVINDLKQDGENFDYLVLLEPTAPLRSGEDIRKCIHQLSDGNFDSVATYTEAALNPHRAWKIENNRPEIFIEDAVPWLPRQRLPEAFQLNGAVYIARETAIDSESMGMVVGRTGAVLMPKERSIDIDHQIDFIIAEAIMEELNNN